MSYCFLPRINPGAYGAIGLTSAGLTLFVAGCAAIGIGISSGVNGNQATALDFGIVGALATTIGLGFSIVGARMPSPAWLIARSGLGEMESAPLSPKREHGMTI